MYVNYTRINRTLKKKELVAGKMIYKGKLSQGQHYFHSKGPWRKLSHEQLGSLCWARMKELLLVI